MTVTKSPLTTAIKTVIALACASTAIQASTNAFVVPSFRGAPGSAVAGWENFTVAVGAPGNSPDLPGSTATTARLIQNQADAFITGTGNIYNQPSASSFTVSYAAGVPLGLVVFQARTVGTELDYSSIALTYSGGTLTTPQVELSRAPFVGQGPGAIVSSEWTWNLTGLNASALSINFIASGPSVSFDSATLDVQTTPEPGAWALLLAGLAAGCFHFRRRV